MSQTSRAADSCRGEDLLPPSLFLSLRVAQSEMPGYYDTRLCRHWASTVVYKTTWVLLDTEKSRALSAPTRRPLNLLDWSVVDDDAFGQRIQEREADTFCPVPDLTNNGCIT